MFPKRLGTRKRPLYEQFAIVRLKTQIRVTDPEWLDLLQHVWHGKLNEMHITTHEGCPLTSLRHLGEMLFWLH